MAPLSSACLTEISIRAHDLWSANISSGLKFGGNASTCPLDRRHLCGDFLRNVALFLPFRCIKERQMAARAGTRRRSKIVGVYGREGRIRPHLASRRKERLTLLFPPVNRRVAGSSPARASPFKNLRTLDLSSDLHVALFRAHFMRSFLRCPKAPGCSRTSNDFMR